MVMPHVVINGYIVHWLWVAQDFWARMDWLISESDRFQATAKARKAAKAA